MEPIKLSGEDKQRIREVVITYFPEYSHITFGKSMLGQDEYLFFWKPDIIHPHINRLDCRLHWLEFIHYHLKQRIDIKTCNDHNLKMLATIAVQLSS